jgi:hypothetical protein
MKLAYLILLFLFTVLALELSAQADSSESKNNSERRYGARDSVYAARINYAGNLMIGGGVGLAIAGGFLIWEGVETYNTPASPQSTNPAADVQQNHSQGTAYIAAGAVAFVGSAILIGLGAKNKIEFKQRKKLMSLQTGLLDNGKMGAMLTF